MCRKPHLIKFILTCHFQVGGNDKTYLRVTEVKLQEPSNLAAWRVDLKKPLAAGAEQTIQVDVYLAKAFQLYPEEISQREKQMVICSFVHSMLKLHIYRGSVFTYYQVLV